MATICCCTAIAHRSIHWGVGRLRVQARKRPYWTARRCRAACADLQVPIWLPPRLVCLTAAYRRWASARFLCLRHGGCQRQLISAWPDLGGWTQGPIQQASTHFAAGPGIAAGLVPDRQCNCIDIAMQLHCSLRKTSQPENRHACPHESRIDADRPLPDHRARDGAPGPAA